MHNKFIKTQTYIKALNCLNNSYFNVYIIYREDQLMNYFLMRIAKSFYFSKRIGYYYLKNEMSITANINKLTKTGIKFIFIYLKMVFEYSKNTKYAKDILNLLFTRLIILLNIENNLAKLSSKKDLNFYYNIINLYLNCKFITNENKYYLNHLKNIIRNKLNYISIIRKNINF
jgi:hypothetical protein